MSFYDKMFSTLGYKTLRVILGVDDESLTDEEKRQLINLVILMGQDEDLKDKVDELITSNIDDGQKLDLLFKLEKEA